MSKTFRRIFITVLLALTAISAVAAAACSKKPNYYTLNFDDSVAGVTFTLDNDAATGSPIYSGAQIKEGYTVYFTVTINSEKVTLTGEKPEVTANDTALQADENGKYALTVTQDVLVKVANAFPINRYTVNFDKGKDENDTEGRVTFKDKDGKELTSLENVEANTTLSFTADVSVYYQNNYKILANTTELTAKDGVYSFTVKGNTTVSVSGLKLDIPYPNRENGGNGTKEDPYKIERPIDLYMMADLINNSFYAPAKLNTAYYSLENDIDMKGEQLYIIGDQTTLDYGSSYFCGSFDGKGHTIKNYVIKDSIIEQSEFKTQFIPMIGLFGFCNAPDESAPALISNLNLENFEINVTVPSAMPENYPCAVGGIAGYNIGVDIVGCSVSGKITVTADNNEYTPIAVGGVCGVLESANLPNKYATVIRSCASEVEITGGEGYFRAGGGVVGALSSIDERKVAAVINSYATKYVLYAVSTGGVVGMMGAYSSVSGCYSTADYVSAKNTLNIANPEYVDAYGGGVVGSAEYGCVISDSFSLKQADATTTNKNGKAYKDGVVGFKRADGEAYIESYGAVVLNSVCKADIDDNYIKNTLHWDEADWTFGDGYPKINRQEATKTFTVTISGNGFNSTKQIKDIYAPMAYWNDITGGIPEFVENGNLRSYGYYFENNEGLKGRVPYSYFPTRDITLYTAFADYSKVAGNYYLQRDLENGAYLTLTADGRLTFKNGAFKYDSYYTYDGNSIILYNTVISRLHEKNTDLYYSFKATVDGGVMTITDNNYFGGANALKAIKEIDGFGYGSYVFGSATYTFNRDGRGVKQEAETKTAFSYTVAENTVTVKIDGQADIQLNLSEANNKHDIFEGVWEKSATTHKKYKFDGLGNWSSEEYAYDAEGKVTGKTEENGTYTVSSGVATLSGGTQDGTQVSREGKFLSVGGETYYRENSFMGEWKYFGRKEQIKLNLYGIGADGVGEASVEYSTVNYDAYYDIRTDGDGKTALCLFVNDSNIGTLYFDTKAGTLTGTLYSARKNDTTEVTLCLKDEFEGEWISLDEGLAVVKFNGYGSYALKGTATTLAVNGTVWINGRQAGSYTLENSKMEGSFTYKDVEYSLGINPTTGKIEITPAGGSAVVFESYDEWKGVTLYDGDGVKYTFDGKGKLNKGTMTATPATGEPVYEYSLNGESVVLKDRGTIAPDTATDSYKLTLDSQSKNLYIDGGFKGKWIVGTPVTGLLEIGNIGYSRKAQGKLDGESVEFTYDGEFLTFTLGNLTMYIKKADADGSELLLGYDKEMNNRFVCIPKGTQDEFAGIYKGNNKLLVLNGLDGSRFGSGTATEFVPAGENEEAIYVIDGKNYVAVKSYTYSKDERGNIILTSELIRYALVKADDGEFEKGGNKYNIVTTKFYGVETSDKDGNKYLFDGVGGLYKKGKTDSEYVLAYRYEILEQTEEDLVNSEYKLNLTDLNGKQLSAVLDYGNFDTVLTIEE